MIIDSYKFASVPMDADAAAYIARFTVPPSSQIETKINTFFLTLKSIGVWSKLDTFILSKGIETQQAGLLDLKRVSTAVLNGLTAWTTTDGFLGSADVSQPSFVNQGYTPSTDAVNMTPNAAGMGVYLTGLPTSAITYTHGLFGAYSPNYRSRAVVDSTDGYFWQTFINSGGTAMPHSSSSALAVGIIQLNRTAKDASALYVNSTIVCSDTANDDTRALPDYCMTLCAGWAVGSVTPSLRSDCKIGASWAGLPLTSDEQSDLKTALETFWS